MSYIVDVAPAVYVPRPHRGIFTYRSHTPLFRGALVEIPFGRRNVLGIVVGSSGLKSVRGTLKYVSFARTKREGIFFSETSLRFLEWESRSTATSFGVVADRAIPAWARSDKIGWNIPENILKGSAARALFSPSVKRPAAYFYGEEEERIRRYLTVIRKILRRKEQVLVLAPTAEMRSRLLVTLQSVLAVSAPYGRTKIAKLLWLRIRFGEPLCIVGSQNDLRLPFSNLGLVVLDEEANALWKETRAHPYTDARIGARSLASLNGARIVIGGKLPLVENFARNSKRMPRQEPLGNIKVVDLKEDLPHNGISNEAAEALREFSSLLGCPKAFVFMNRLGAATAFHCADCGFIFVCTECSAPVSVYRDSGLKSAPQQVQREKPRYQLRCRHCGQVFIPPLVCPSCRGFRLFPKGVAGEKLQEEIERLFPEVWIGRLDSDIAPRKKDRGRILEAFRSQSRPAVLVGTAMALQETLPNLDLVLLSSFEQLFAVPNFRVEEEAFSLFTVLRARLRPQGKFFVQTWHPEHALFKTFSRGNFSIFARRELLLRKRFGWPPYRRIAKLTFSHRDNGMAAAKAARLTENLQKALRRQSATALQREVVGPFPGFTFRIRGQYVWRILLKWKADNPFDLKVETLLWDVVPPAWDIDVNPGSIL